MHASFSVYDLDPFENKNAKINEVWLQGVQQPLNTFNSITLAGSYDINIDGFRRKVVLNGNGENPTCKSYELDASFKSIDSTKCKCDFQMSGNDISIKLINRAKTSAYLLRGKISKNGSIIEGAATAPDGSWKSWSALKVLAKEVKEVSPIEDTS